MLIYMYTHTWPVTLLAGPSGGAHAHAGREGRCSFCLQWFGHSSVLLWTLLGAPGLTTRNKKLLGAPGIATRSKMEQGRYLGSLQCITRPLHCRYCVSISSITLLLFIFFGTAVLLQWYCNFMKMDSAQRCLFLPTMMVSGRVTATSWPEHRGLSSFIAQDRINARCALFAAGAARTFEIAIAKAWWLKFNTKIRLK